MDAPERPAVDPRATPVTDEDRGMEAAASGVHARALALAEALPTRGRLLDAPCGAGALGAALRAQGYEVHGIDLVPHAAQQLAPEHFRVADLDRGCPSPTPTSTWR